MEEVGKIVVSYAYLIPAFTAVLAGTGVFVFCKDIRRFHKYMGFTLIFEGLFMLLAGFILSSMRTYSTAVFVLYYLMMLLSPFFYYFASRYFLKETGVKEKDFWMLEAVILFILLFTVVAGHMDSLDTMRFLRIVSGKEPIAMQETTGVAVLLSFDNVAYLLFIAEQLFVQIFCFVNLARYKKLLESYYSNLDGKSADKILVVFILLALRFVIFVSSDFVSDPAAVSAFQITRGVVFSAFYVIVAIFVCRIHYTAEELSSMIASSVGDGTVGNDIRIQATRRLSSAVYETLESRIGRLVEEKFFLDSDIDLFTISTKIQINTKYISDYLKTKYGETFLTFVNRLRVEYAVALMGDNTDNLLDIAEKSGFISQSTFYRNFTKLKGVSPAEFRKNPANFRKAI